MVAVYEFKKVTDDNLMLFNRLSNYRRDACDNFYIDKILNDCEILNPVNSNKNHLDDLWYIKCHCGNIFETKLHRITYDGGPKSCGCIRINKNKSRSINRTGLIVKNCKILEKVDHNNYSDFYKIECHCGKIFHSSYLNLFSGNTNSCGCIRKKIAKENKIKALQEYRISKGFDPNERMHNTKEVFMRETIFVLIKPLILKIDSNTCNICLEKTDNLEVHHIAPLSEMNSFKNEKDFYPVYNLNNLITLCHDCHMNKAHDGSGKYLNEEIKEDLLAIVNMRPILQKHKEEYKEIVLKIKEKINEFISV